MNCSLHHSQPLVEPKTSPNNGARWCPLCEHRCRDCGTDRHTYYSFNWGHWVCSGCAANRLGA